MLLETRAPAHNSKKSETFQLQNLLLTCGKEVMGRGGTMVVEHCAQVQLSQFLQHEQTSHPESLVAAQNQRRFLEVAADVEAGYLVQECFVSSVLGYGRITEPGPGVKAL